MIKRGFVFTLKRELFRMMRYKTFLFCIVMIPILTFLFLSIVFYNGVPTHLPVAVLDQDQTPLSRQCSRMIDAAEHTAVRYQISSIEEGRQMIKDGKVSAVVVFPLYFERDIYANRSVEVPIFVNGANLLVSSLLQKDIKTAVLTFSTGVEINKLTATGKSESEAYQLSMPIALKQHILFNPYISYAYYLLPGFMPMMLLFFVILASVFSIGIELKRGTARYWLSASGNHILKAVTAKLLPYTFLFLALDFLMNVVMFRFFGVPLQGNVPVLIIANILFVLAYQWMGVLFILLFDNLRLALSIAAGYSVLAFTFSGLTFPFIAMNPEVALLGNLFPMTFYMNTFMDQAMRGAPVIHSVPYLLILCLFIFIPMLFLKRLEKLCRYEKYWGKI